MLHYGAGRKFVRWQPSGQTAQAAADALIVAMTVPPNAARQAVILGTIQELMNAGVWVKMDLLYVLAAHDEQAGRLNWRTPGTFTLAYTAGLTSSAFTIDRGFTGTGVASATLNTNWIPSTNAVQMTLNSAHWGMVSNTEKVAVDEEFTVNSGFFMQVRWNTTQGQVRISSATATSFNSATSIGHFIALRPDAATQGWSFNGVVQAPQASVATSLPLTQAFLLSRGATSPSTRQAAAAHAGATLSDTEILATYYALLNYRAAVGQVTDPASLLISAMTVRPDVARQTLIRNLVSTLVTAGIWAKLDVFYILAAHDAQAARLNWKNPAANAATAVNSPTFTSDRGYEGNGAGAYLNMNYNPTTFGGVFTLNSAMFGIWNRRPNTLGGTFEVYATLGNMAASTSNYTGRLNDAGANLALGSAPPAGNYAIRRTLATEQSLWVTGTQRATNATAATTNCTNFTLFGSTASFYGNGQHGAFYAGAGTLSDVDMATMNTALGTYMTAVGA